MKQIDDLEAVRIVAGTLEPFSEPDRERIVRWAFERLGMVAGSQVAGTHVAPATKSGVSAQTTTSPTPEARDIRSFIQEKDPKNDSQLAAVVAYYHQFVAPENDRKESITSADLTEACRTADRARPSRPAQTLVNAYGQGLLNRGEYGHYTINAVGENLVAMVLPDDAGATGARRTASRLPTKRQASKKRTSKRSPANKSKKKRAK